MLAFLASAMLQVGASVPQSDTRLCYHTFGDVARFGSVFLFTDADYQPRSMRLIISEPDGWSRAEVVLDPLRRRTPGVFSHAFFLVPFTSKPTFPLTLKGYADGQLRWRKMIYVPYWPLTGSPPSNGGTADSIGKADDGRPVVTPRELRIALTDAKGKLVGDLHYPVLSAEIEPVIAKSLAAIEAAYQGHTCHPPPPPLHH